MKKTAITLFAFAGAALSAAEADFATPKEAEALVAKLVKVVAANKAEAFKEVNAKDPKWVRGDLYPWVIDSQGTMLAHGANDKLVGKALLELEDVDGKQFVKEYIQATNAKGKAWSNYKWSDPVTKKVLPKAAYCEKVSDVLVCAGIYKR